MTIAKISGDGTTLLQAWSDPIRFTPKDGTQGSQGFSPALVFRGNFDGNATYYGNPYRVDAVKVGDSYYVTRVDAEALAGVEAGTGFNGGEYPVQEMELWNAFGASFDSVATNLLLAENANIAGWIFRNGRLESQDGTIWLDGKKGEIMAKGGFEGSISADSLFLPFKLLNTDHTLTVSSPTNINFHPVMMDAILTLPDGDTSFNGMFLNVYWWPRLSKMDGQAYIQGRIFCPNKCTVVSSLVSNMYFAKQITSIYGGIVQLTNVGGVWVLLNGSNLLEYEEY